MTEGAIGRDEGMVLNESRHFTFADDAKISYERMIELRRSRRLHPTTLCR
jgi:rhamnose utilization protein RhaD (predicted bifunctional aldolase and dehydrogenase)